MFGYVKPRAADLRVREYDFYRAAYCGVCRRMKALTGRASTCSLSYDFVFLALCRMLTAPECRAKKCRCIAHPCRGKQCLTDSAALDYTARAAAILSCGKLEDDIHDERGGRRLRARLALPFFRRAEKRAALPELSAAVRARLAELQALEHDRTPSVDAPADVFGALLGEVFRHGLPEETAEPFYRVGFHLGRYIYTADAAQDYEQDLQSGAYNPYVLLYPEGLDVSCARTALLLELGTLGRAVDALPFGNAEAVKEIVRNTVYLGLYDRISFLKEPDRKDAANEKSL